MSRQDIIVRMRLAGEEFERDFKVKFQELERTAAEQSGKAGEAGGNAFAKRFLSGAALAGLGTAIGVAINKAAALGDEITSLGRQFNIGAEEIQVWQFAAHKAGLSSQAFTDALGNLTAKIGEANAGNARVQQSFVNLGIGFQTVTGEARNTDAVMQDLARRIAEIEDPAERVRVGQQLLGDQFRAIYPLLLDVADGTGQLRAEMDEFGGVLTSAQIQELERVNGRIEEMKNQLSRSVARVVAENADAIDQLIGSVTRLGNEAVKATGQWLGFMGALGDYNAAVDSLPKNLSPSQRGQAVAGLDRAFGRSETVTGSTLFGTIKTKDVRFGTPGNLYDPANIRALGNVGAVTSLNRNFVRDLLADISATGTGDAAPPRVTGGGGGGGGRAGRARNATQSAADREAEKAARDAIRNEEQLRDAIARTLRAQQDSAEVERIRADQGEVAAARAEARLNFERQHPLAIYDTVEALGVALGITKELTDADRQRLQLLIDQGKAARSALMDAAGSKAQGSLDRERAKEEEAAARAAEVRARAYEAEMERAIFDLAGIYETAFRGGTRGFLDLLKDEGTRIIAEIAAQWTLSMIAKQPFSFSGALDMAMSRSPLGSIFSGSQTMAGMAGTGGLTGNPYRDFAAANDNAFWSIGPNAGPMALPGGIVPTKAQAAAAGGGVAMLKSAGFSLALGSIASSLVPAGGGLGSQIGGMAGSIGGMALGGKLAALGSFGGPIGSIAGAVIGTLLGGLLDGGFGPKRGQVTIGNSGGQLGIVGQTGKSDLRQQAGGGANNLIDALNRIAGQIGATVDPTRGSVSLGIRDGDWRVDTTGGGATRVKGGAIDFGQDQQAAIRFALADLIRDGVLTGISQASQNLLQNAGTDLEKQLEKVMMIEAVPRLLRERLDPLGFALDELFDKFKGLADAMTEAGASAEQVAEAQRLWELEKAETITSIGAASQTLKDFLASLNAGSNSPLSLREQRAEAEAQLSPFLAQIAKAESARAEVERLRGGGAGAAEIEAAEKAARTAAAAIDQSGFTNASQLLLSISRQSNASTGTFFSDFDRIRALTGQAIGFVDQATANNDTRDPWGRETANNTGEIVFILQDHTRLLMALNDNLAMGGSGGGGGGFTQEPRLFAAN